MAKKYINDLDLFLSVSIVIWGRIGFAQRSLWMVYNFYANLQTNQTQN